MLENSFVKFVRLFLVFAAISVTVSPIWLKAEGQEGQDYKGVTDPFGDPANYEFADDEKDDKEFFHLGRFLMFGVDAGAGIYTGGLGSTTSTGFYFGGRFIYFFDKSLAMEAAVHYSTAVDVVAPTSSQILEINTALIPITLGFRYYFNVRNAPKAIAIANPYLAAGGGIYMRTQDIVRNVGFSVASTGETDSAFGGYAGAGFEFNVYKRHVYLGLDFRYHLIFFPDEGDNFGVSGVNRSGDYVSGVLSVTYSF